MAERAKTETNMGDYVIVDWPDLDNADTGKPTSLPTFPDKTVHVLGAACDIEGSNDGTNWVLLTDASGNDIDGVAAGTLVTIRENPLYIRPVSGGANARVILIAVR